MFSGSRKMRGIWLKLYFPWQSCIWFNGCVIGHQIWLRLLEVINSISPFLWSNKSVEKTRECTRWTPTQISPGEKIKHIHLYYYRLPTKLEQGNVFSGACHSVLGRGWVCLVAGPFWERGEWVCLAPGPFRGGYAWFQASLRGWGWYWLVPGTIWGWVCQVHPAVHPQKVHPHRRYITPRRGGKASNFREQNIIQV